MHILDFFPHKYLSLQDISEAYETLSDKDKRRIYDQVGKKGLEGGANGGGGGGFGGGFPGGVRFTSSSAGHIDPRDLFAQFFGNSVKKI